MHSVSKKRKLDNVHLEALHLLSGLARTRPSGLLLPSRQTIRIRRRATLGAMTRTTKVGDFDLEDPKWHSAAPTYWSDPEVMPPGHIKGGIIKVPARMTDIDPGEFYGGMAD